MKVVLDINVLVSGMINPHGAPGKIVDFIRTGLLRLVVDDRILAEYIDVLRRDYFNAYFDEHSREDVIEYLSKNSLYTVSRFVAGSVYDPADAPFFEIALTENVPLVTGNRKHFPESVTDNHCTALRRSRQPKCPASPDPRIRTRTMARMAAAYEMRAIAIEDPKKISSLGVKYQLMSNYTN